MRGYAFCIFWTKTVPAGPSGTWKAEWQRGPGPPIPFGAVYFPITSSSPPPFLWFQKYHSPPTHNIPDRDISFHIPDLRVPLLIVLHICNRMLPSPLLVHDEILLQRTVCQDMQLVYEQENKQLFLFFFLVLLFCRVFFHHHQLNDLHH